jgi:hypothetical protein
MGATLSKNSPKCRYRKVAATEADAEFFPPQEQRAICYLEGEAVNVDMSVALENISSLARVVGEDVPITQPRLRRRAGAGGAAPGVLAVEFARAESTESNVTCASAESGHSSCAPTAQGAAPSRSDGIVRTSGWSL